MTSEEEFEAIECGGEAPPVLAAKSATTALVRAALKHADQPNAPVHKLSGPSDNGSAK